MCYNGDMEHESKLMWCAGFFQGEGYVGVRRGDIKALDVAITQYGDRTPLDRFAEYVGCGRVGGPYKTASGSESFQFRKTGRGAEAIIESILPLLTGKKLIQAESALREMAEYREKMGGFNKKNRKKNTKEFCPQGHPYELFGRPNSTGHTVCKKCIANSRRAYNARKKRERERS